MLLLYQVSTKADDSMKYKMDIEKLIRDDGFIYTKDVVTAGIHKSNIKSLVESGELVREARGIYSVSSQISDEFSLLQSRCKKGIFSYGTALYFHGLSDRFPAMISMTIPQTYNVYYLQQELLNVEFHRVKPELWKVGIIEGTSPQGYKILLYDKERCICDMIKDKKKSDPQIFKQCLIEYFSSSNKNTLKLMKYAKIFGIEEKVETYMEVLV